ncbi:CARDB domain-containing protein [Halobacterium jilantaiense]|uniref:CARDB protein n=1 Tax=Halobacterium jilantaiense TaxID=355548 RepID=A0A1I0PUN7_9EURY|nr:CARDB domain-containing protein [Halobacterium jilantaiense]SEW18160.1 CARDB protein [Halobacterium jilantaiense]
MGRRTLALAAAFALAGTLVLPSAAAPLLGGPSDAVDARGEVELLPATDSEYASVGADGELALDLAPGDAGLNPGAVTAFEEVFYVRYTGDRYAEVWVTADSAAVAFEVDGQRAGSAAERVRVGPSEVVPVSVRVNTSAGDVRPGELTVHSRVADGGERETTDEPATDDTEVSIPAVQRRAAGSDSVSFTMLSPTAGDSLTLDTRLVVAGEGDRAAVLESLTVTPASSDAMTVDVERTGTEPVPSAAADELGAVRVDASAAVDAATFRLTVDDAFLDDVAVADVGDLSLYRQSDGEWSEVPLSVVGEREGGVVVEGTADDFSTFVLAAERPDIAVREASVSPSSIGADDSATVTATVVNDGGAAGERTVPVTVDGAVVAERSVRLDAGETATVTAPVAPESGEHAIAVDGVDAGTLVVEAGDSSSSDDGTDGDVSAAEPADAADDPLAEPAGFDVETLAAAGFAVVLVVVGIAAWRRRGDEE